MQLAQFPAENTPQNKIINFLDLKLFLKSHKIYADIYDKRWYDMIFHLMLIQLLTSVLVYIVLPIEIFVSF